MRVRERVLVQDEPVDTELVTTCLTPATNYTESVYSVSNNTAYGTTLVEHTEDIVTPNYRARSANGDIINNPFSRTRTTTIGPQAMEVDVYRESNYWPVVHGAPRNTWWRFAGTRRFTSGPALIERMDLSEVASLRQEVIDLAVTDAFANVNQEQILALATLGEADKTIEWFVGILRKAIRVFRALRQKNAKALKRELKKKDLIGMYMSARYALRPLIYDVNGMIDSFQAERVANVRQTSRGFRSGTLNGEDLTTDCSCEDILKCDVRREWSYKVSAHAGVLNDVTVDWTQILGLTKLGESAWELLPFSFIADWFFNVGAYVAAHTPDYGVKQLSSWVTVKETFKSSSTPENFHLVYTPSQYDVVVSGTGIGGENAYEQLVLERIVDPEVNWYPRLDLRLDQFKILDLLIVLKSVLL